MAESSERDGVAEITRLVMTYAELQDRSDPAAVSELFRHGAFVVDRVEKPAVGYDEVLRVKRTHDHMYPDGTLRTKHVTTNLIVEVDEAAGTASARSYYTVFQATEGLPLQAIISGRYADRFRRIDGRWWFERRFVHTDLVGDLSHHVDANPMRGFGAEAAPPGGGAPRRGSR